MSDPGKPSVLYVWDGDYPWDVRTEKICRTLADAGHRVGITARNRRREPLEDLLPEGTVYRLPPARALGRRLDDATSLPAFVNPRWTSHLRRTAARFNPDVILVRDLPLAPAAIRLGRRRGVPVLLDMAENYPAMIADIWQAGRQRAWDIVVRHPAAVRRVERHCIARVDATLVVVEESGARLMDLGVPPDRIVVVSNTPPMARVVPRAAPSPGQAPRIVYLGLMELPRGVAELIEAVAVLRQGGHEAALTLVGDGRDRALLEARARELRLPGSAVRFLGFVPNREALEIVKAADIGVVPHHAVESWNTTIPNKLFDYMAAGLAVATSDAAPAARIVRETGAGTVFRSRDAQDCARALGELFDEGRRDAAGRSGQAAIRARYNWETDAARLLALVRQSPLRHSARRG